MNLTHELDSLGYRPDRHLVVPNDVANKTIKSSFRAIYFTGLIPMRRRFNTSEFYPTGRNLELRVYAL